ncbi:bestrophin, RFP-TM, chloride channel [Nitzschia inconspicua]|uniref:Bestrophin, RFP-TM, chloride channel n=1 Tax=Nitzschia inconspicua TaxID=303405 RepID=A0A9K3KSK1_9STRA|nr:bestrophin, RFP-TM, chloride channel [Nitzschia inconspicua]
MPTSAALLPSLLLLCGVGCITICNHPTSGGGFSVEAFSTTTTSSSFMQTRNKLNNDVSSSTTLFSDYQKQLEEMTRGANGSSADSIGHQQAEDSPPKPMGSYLDSLSQPQEYYSSVQFEEAPLEEVAAATTTAAASTATVTPIASPPLASVQSGTTTTPPPPPPMKPTVKASSAAASIASKATPMKIDSSPTLSATSPTISITLPVGLRPPKLEKPKNIKYGEESRKFRRTVYTHDDWERHRSPDRFVRNLVSITSSGVYKNMAREAILVTLLTVFVMVYNGCVTGYQDISGAYHDPVWSSPWLPPLTLPLQVFTLTSPSLSLLLAYRTNTAYQRWDEARKNWGMNINHTRDLVRMGNAYYDRTAATEEERQEDLKRLSLCTWAFVRSMKRHLSPEAEDEAEFKAELYEKLPKNQAQAIIKAAHRPNRALYDLSMAIENLPMHFLRKNEMHAALTIFEDNLGSSERLLTSPVPLFYNRHTARFLSVWLLLVPFALWEPFGFMWNHIGMLPTMAVVTLLLFGIEELATQMEEPFTILPMQAFCDKIGNWCNEIVSWKDGDNGVESNQSFQGFVDLKHSQEPSSSASY